MATTSIAPAKVAFVQILNPQGAVVQLEPGGSYAHIAISYKGAWLHAHPYRGVEIISSEQLAKMGVVDVMTVTDTPEPSEAQIRKVLGKPYDLDFRWEGEKYYCSKLVGKLLNLEPLPMNFSSALWRNHPSTNRRRGLSPDDIFQELLRRGENPSHLSFCSKVL